ncbi:phage capsid protein [Acinetobacter lwoffii]|uniref:phage capsid protein n=1 Tax=Acinetobacter lwoffii TaxID=28090 RepID=UPI0019D592A3|nr:phage capsid protein [Acinetobacter lwoffii]
MSITNQDHITAAFVRQYADSFTLASQQKDSRLLSTILNEGHVVGSSFTINDLGTVDFSNAGARFGTTNLVIPEAGTRIVNMADYNLFLAVEPRDLPKLKADPTDSYMQSLIAAKNRLVDKVIYNALIGTISRKQAEADSTATAVALPSTQIIASGATGITKAKLIQARALFAKNEVEDEELFILYNSEMLNTILSDTTLTSSDYMAVKMLQEGDVANKWLGFTWVHYETLADGATAADFRTVVYARSAAKFGEATVKELSIDDRPDLNYVKQLGGIYSYGAGRTNEKKVVAIDFKKAA